MKTLYIVRHAKSSWENMKLSDFERPLNDRGRHDAPMMAERLRKIGVQPGRIVSSPAERAMQTAETFAEALGIVPASIETRMVIYEGGAQELLHLVRGLSAEDGSVMLFGHNPVLTQLANLLGDTPMDSLPTCAIVRLDFDTAGWDGIVAGKGKTVWVDYPKKGR